jgi:lambda family phage portal protein
VKKYQFDFLSRLIASAVGTVFPGTAISYLQKRKKLAQYTSARRTGPDKLWKPGNLSADAILARDRAVVMSLARDLERNSPHVSGAINKICNNIIYTGIFPQARLKGADGKLKKTKNDYIENGFEEWAEAIQFYEKQELALRHLLVDGEVLAHQYFDKNLLKQGVIPLGIDLLESDYIDSTVSGVLENGNTARSGIEYDTTGWPIAYHLYKEHPGESTFSKYSGQTRRIPAFQICHVFHPRRASQGRGISWLASIICEMRDFTEYQSNERIANRLLSAFGIFLETPYPEHQLANPLFQEPEDEAAEETETAGKYIEPGRIDVLPQGTKPHAFQYTRPGITYEPFTKVSLKSASTGTGISYENFSNDYEGATFSSARQAVLEERRGYRKVQFFLNRRFNNWIWRSWNEYANLSMVIGKLPDKIPVQWQNPGWPWIDPAKDAKGAEIELGLKITNRRRLAAERGLDWDEEIDELAEEESILKEKGLQDEISKTPAGNRPEPGADKQAPA